MVGSRDSIANPNIVLNTIVAEAFADACDILEKADDFDLAVHDLIKEYLTDNQRIIFNGNGYSDEWVAEAEREPVRTGSRSMVEAILQLQQISPSSCLRDLVYLQRQSLSPVQRSSMRHMQRQLISRRVR